MRKRILAWIALIVFLLLFVNVLFIHYRVTESVTILMLYVLFFFYYKRRQDNTEDNTEFNKDKNKPKESDASDENTPES